MQQVEIQMAATDVISYAATYNGAPTVLGLRITPRSGATLRDLSVTMELLSLDEEWATPWRQHVDVLGPEGIVWNDSELRTFTPNVQRLLAQRELRQAEIVVTVVHDGEEVGSARFPVTALAASGWVLSRPLLRSAATLAAFAQPQEPALAPLLVSASQILTDLGASNALDGYQSQDPQQVDRLAAAVYEAVRAHGLTYANPPAGWDLAHNASTAGQRVRVPGEVIAEGLATCLDSTVLMVALLEAIGLRPLIFVIPRHAFVGYWRYDRDFSMDGGAARFDAPVVTVRDALSDIDVGRIGLLETTMLCGGEQSSPADEARREARRRLQFAADEYAGDPDLFASTGGAEQHAVVVDVVEVRFNAKVSPLPVRSVDEEGNPTLVEYRAQSLTIDVLRETIASAGGGSAAPVMAREAPLRIKRWQDSLLDLSLRNSLLNYRFPARSSAGLFVTEEILGPVEDMLQNGQSLQLSPAPQTGSGDTVRTLARRSVPVDLEPIITEQLVGNRRLITSLSEAEFAPRLRRMMANARSVVEETGSNGLFLALGMVAWAPEGKGKELVAPLILVPVVLKPSDRNRRFALEIDPTGSITPNFSLAERLKQEFQLDLPKLIEPESDDAGVDIDGLIAYMRERFREAGLRDFRVDPASAIGFFDFSTYRLWRDLSDNWPRYMQNSRLVKHLVESPTQTFVDEAMSSEGEPDPLDEFAATLPVLADGSQALAVQQAMNGATFVLQGPPGTGKSQTITNLLARALHAGKRVLFVAEKAGALSVVRDRLAAVGLGAFGLNLHDKGMRPADVRRQLTEALDAAAATDRVGFDAARRDIERAIEPLQLYPGRLHAVGALGESAYSARNKLLAITTEAELPVPSAFVAAVDLDGLGEVRRCFRDAREVAARAKSAMANSWSFLGSGPITLDEDRRQRLSALAEELQNSVEAVRRDPDALSFLQTVEDIEELTRLGVLAERELDLATIDLAASTDAVQGRGHVTATIDGFSAASIMPGAVPKSLSAPVAELRALADTALSSFFLGRKKRLLAVCARLQEYLSAEAAVDRENLLPVLAELEKLQATVKDYTDFLRAMPGVFVAPGFNILDDEQRSALAAQVARLDQDVALARDDGSPRAARVRALVGSVSSAGAAVGRLALAWLSMSAELQADPTSLELWQGDRAPGEALTSSASAMRSDARERDFVQLRRWIELRDLLRPVEAHGLTDAVRDVLSGSIPPAEIDLAFERGFLTTLLRRLLDEQALDAFDGARHDAHARAYAVAADTLRELSPGVLAEDMIANRGFQPGAAIGAVGELRRELGRQRGFKPIRRLLRDHWTVISRVTPLVLAVPDALVRFVDGDLEPFDLVVFDEASQIKVAHAIGALGRGRSAVIVGDSKQMPPTSIAQATGGADADDASEDEAETVPKDEESILSEAERAWVPQTYLTWHYRSEDETLIAFSNAKYYEGRLSSLPAPTQSREHKGLSFVKVDGRFVRQTKGAGADKGTNRSEAEAIVAEIVRRVRDDGLKQHSIGVVTLNKPQQELVLSLLLATEDDAVIAALNPEQTAEPIAVWNLETVQGHERDVILFSIGFSKDENGRLSRNFGPLVHAGGERRLNVAVTRARRQVIVYCSFEPEDLRAEGLSLGLQQLSDYLRLAKYGPEATGATGARALGAPDRHRDDVAHALRDRGLRVATEVGLSDFKVDIAVARSSSDGEWSVGVLTDGDAWRSRATVGDRDALPIVLLGQRMGWPAVTRVWTPDWLRDREGVVDAIERLVDQVESGEHTVSNRVEPDGSLPDVFLVDHFPVPDLPDSDFSGPDPAEGDSEVDPAAPIAAVQVDRPAPIADRAGGVTPGVVRHPTLPAPPWEEWIPSSPRPSYVLDQLYDVETRKYLRAIVLDIIATEGPVLAARAARLVGRLHGLGRVHETRVQAIIAAIGTSLPKSPDGFYFAPDAGPDDYDRWHSGGSVARKVDEISLAEISNVMVHVAKIGLGASREELVTSTGGLIGFQRITVGIRQRLEQGVDEAVRRGVLRLDGDHYQAS